ncbi:phage capsid protein [Salidesulfovibrio brasiliensis]|uniref:phage capsid protein n=1 Tax=Salidesulfovibrio brasiliensis TaxID=221711 RepID=UPI0006CF86FA|nr:phage capsid protein [Salidesulfovibrio brasiliensis]
MSFSVDQAFIKQYGAEVHTAYQQKQAKLRKTVRLKTSVKGSEYIFQRSGKGKAGKKTRHGNVPLMNVDHSHVTAVLEDLYAGDYVDKLDTIKTNIDERGVLANAGAYAMGRKIDDLIITKLDGATEVIPSGDAVLTKAKVLQGFGTLNANDVPDDGERYALVGAEQYNNLLEIEEFKNADYAGDALPWLKGAQARKWLNITWIMHTGLPLVGGVRKCFLYHKSAAGLAEGLGITPDINWIAEKAAHFVNHMMSAGAVLIDPEGVVEIECKEA